MGVTFKRCRIRGNNKPLKIEQMARRKLQEQENLLKVGRMIKLSTFIQLLGNINHYNVEVGLNHTFLKR